jgi:ornithine--oxo-acid transaminase
MNDIILPQHTKTVRLIGVPIGCGSGDPRCAAAPDALRDSDIAAQLSRRGVPARWTRMVRPTGDTGADARAQAYEVCVRLSRRVARIASRGELPVVIGGDHTCAIGTWKGMARAMAARGSIGLLWIDAHMDAHTPETTESGRLHGMPVACLLGHGYPELVSIAGGIRLDPACVCLFGVRSFERGEAQLLERLGVRIFFMEEIRQRGIHECLREAIGIVRGAKAGFGITLDLDAIDPRDAPGISTPAPGGMPAAALVTALAQHGDDPRLLGIEIVEYNPFLDHEAKTEAIVHDAIHALLLGSAGDPAAASPITIEQRYGASNYDSLPVVLVRGRGVHAWDDAGRRYIDMMSAYSALSHGHLHPRILTAMQAQATRLAVTSRAYYNNRLPPFLKRLCEVTGQDLALPTNTGQEAVEVALKAARKWGTKVKGIPEDKVEIIACRGNFHGRSIAILAMSTEPQYRDGFGPYPAGFVTVPYGDAGALERAISPHTAAFLVEPIQGEAGIVMPPPGYLAACARICRERNVLLICDEVQTGLGRTGRMLACEHEGVKPDGVILGKALGGGLLPVSAFVARRDVMGVFRPGDHGSTFGGNALASAVGLEALAVLIEERLPQRAAELGDYFLERLRASSLPLVREIRGQGLLIGVELDPALSAREVCVRLLAHGVLTKDTHHSVVRLTPPLVITREEIDAAVEALRRALAELARRPEREHRRG